MGDSDIKAVLNLAMRWQGIKGRCYVRSNISYGNYGGRGIYLCDEWKKDCFAFVKWSLQNGYAPDLDLDRTDNDGPYSPGNCRWVSRKVNCRNQRRTRFLTAFGETKSRGDWLDDPRCVVDKKTLAFRMKKEWEPERALAEPLNESILVNVTAFGETKHLREWSRDPRCVVTYKTLHARVTRQGYAPGLAMTTPEITPEIQAAHGRGNSRLIEAFGESKSIEEWARDPRCRVKAPGLWLRLFKYGLPPEEAISRPSRKAKKS